ncbi:ABC transporter permease subunit [Parageobacillus thermoglucosidasius]|uniref:ABC transporter permease n=1 Tax=Parageobacillus thermoglucosidasius TaxID=1426 RepID=UPI002E1C5834|nr:sugar ABC transporter permease [Parageobacillus thermoglucosidasius]MED4913797.1 sugar ABC transporter permease [Parageobacillus thermoglucosidasius]MED4946134.1 sugar ABC transporter permease [Parageobacillus thermoglucosidasius]MED4984007.1 sugar ABC transporter permease [Parageobacillus thermoglucosidasius]
MRFLTRLLKVRELSILSFMIVFFIFVGSINNEFITGDSVSLMVKSSVILLVMAVGQSFVLFTSNIDVSIGSIMGLSAAVCGVLLTNNINVWLVIFIVFIIGAVIGLINGIGVSYFKIPAIIMTLGMLGIIRGIMLIYTEGMWIEEIPNFYKKLSNLKILGIVLPVWVAIAILIVAHIYLTRTKFGRYFYAVGDNEEGARLVGLPVQKVKVLAFIFSGISASVAGLIFVMNIGFVPNQTGSGIELQVIAAAVLGGVSLTGGLGSIVGAGLGAVFFTVINNSLVYLKIPAYWNNAISGLLLLLIVVGDSRLQNYLQYNPFLRKKNTKVSLLRDAIKGDVNK